MWNISDWFVSLGLAKTVFLNDSLKRYSVLGLNIGIHHSKTVQTQNFSTGGFGLRGFNTATQ